MDLQQLRVFRAAALQKGFTRASEELHLSQSTVSQHIKHLEDELGCPLFIRVGRRVVLNSAGKVLLEFAEYILRELKNAEMAVRELGSLKRGIIRLGTGATTLTYRLPTVLAEYHKRFSGIELVVVTGTTEFLLREVKAQRLDLSIAMEPVSDSDLQVEPVGGEELVIALHRDHPASRKPALSPADLATMTFILYEQRTAMQNLIDGHFATLGVEPRVTMEMENIEAIKSLVRAGLGASVLPLCALANPVPSDPVRALRVKGHRLYRNLAIVSLGAGPRPKAIQELSRMIHVALGG